MLLLQEDEKKTEMRKRTPSKKQEIQNRRYFATFISVCIILVGWAAIYAGTYFENEIKAWFFV